LDVAAGKSAEALDNREEDDLVVYYEVMKTGEVGRSASD
jgi:hypothetical protein